MRFTRKCVSNSYFRPCILLLYKEISCHVCGESFFKSFISETGCLVPLVCPLLQLIKDSFEKKLILRLLPPFQKKKKMEEKHHNI